MIEIFKKNLFFNSLLLLLYAMVLRIHDLLHPLAVEELTQNGIQAVLSDIAGGGFWMEFAAIFLLFIQGAFINRLVIKFRMGSQITLLPGMFYILLASFIPSYCYLSLPLIANTFVILGIYQSFKTYNQHQAAAMIFDVGLYMSIASIIYWPYFLLAIVGYISLIMMRSIKWNQRIQYISGLILPYYLWWAYLYAFSDHSGEVFTYLRHLFDLQALWSTDRLTIIIGAACSVFAIAFVLKYSAYTKKKNIQIQKRIDVFFWILFAGGLGLFWSGFYFAHLLLLCIPAAFFLSQNFLNFKNQLVSEVIHLGIVVLLLLLHFEFLTLAG